MESRFVGRIVLVFLKALGWLYYLAPRRLRRGCERALAALMISRRLRSETVRKNLELVYPGADQAPLREALRSASYLSFARLVWEGLMLFGPMGRFVDREVSLSVQGKALQILARDRSVIFLSSHLGNWEVMAAKGGRSGFPLMIVTKHLKPEWLHRAIEKARARNGVDGAYEPRTLKDILKRFKEGGHVGFVLDQFTGAPLGVRVPFFGTPVGTHSVVAMIAKRTGAPVLPVKAYRHPERGWIMEIQDPLPWIEDPNPNRELVLNTAAYVKTLEAHIREAPEQWLWIHNRFKGDLAPLRPGEWDQPRVRT